MKVDVFSLEKYAGLNEDQWHLPEAEGENLFVLCDGASESFDSRGWASLLANGLTSLDDFDNDWLAEKIREYEKAWQGRDLGWAQQRAFDRGSFSTLLALRLSGGKCEVSAIGDSVAFSVNADAVIDKCPYYKAEQFLAHPLLLSTLKQLSPDINENRDDCAYHADLDINGATHVLLLTDAIAHWLMKNMHDPGQIRKLLEIGSQKEFAAFVSQERQRGMRFDDTTMIRIDLDKLPCFRESVENIA